MDSINQPLLDVRDLSVAFHQPSGTSVAVDRISFEIKRGECVALVGESGSGKSISALSILKLLTYPTASHPSGSIRFKGGELLGLSENEIRGIRGNDISIIFQEPMTSLKPLHTVEAQIGEVLHPDTRALLAAEPKPDPAPPRPESPVVISADNLKIWFPIKRGLLRSTVGHIKAVDGVSLAVRKGETLGVVGESGSGKTTLGLALLRLISSQGPIVFLGSNVQGLQFREMRPFRRDMQIVFQDPFGALSPRMSVG